MTVLIMTIVMAAITAGVITARNVYLRISRKADAQTLLATTVSALTADFSNATRFGRETNGDGNDNGTFFTTNRSYSIYYLNNGKGSGSTDKGIYVVPYINGKAESSKKTPLVTQKTQTLDLYAVITAEKPTDGAEPAAGTSQTKCFNHESHADGDGTVTFWVAVYSTMDGISNPVEKAYVCVHTAEE